MDATTLRKAADTIRILSAEAIHINKNTVCIHLNNLKTRNSLMQLATQCRQEYLTETAHTKCSLSAGVKRALPSTLKSVLSTARLGLLQLFRQPRVLLDGHRALVLLRLQPFLCYGRIDELGQLL